LVLCPFSSLCVCSSFFSYTPLSSAIYTLSLHDALPICHAFVYLFGTLHHFIQVVMDARLEPHLPGGLPDEIKPGAHRAESGVGIDRKSTRLNSSHQIISYAVFCLKKKKKKQNQL